MNSNNVFYWTQYFQNTIHVIALKVKEVFFILSLYLLFKINCASHTHKPAHFLLSTSQVLNGHVWLAAAVLRAKSLITWDISKGDSGQFLNPSPTLKVQKGGIQDSEKIWGRISSEKAVLWVSLCPREGWELLPFISKPDDGATGRGGLGERSSGKVWCCAASPEGEGCGIPASCLMSWERFFLGHLKA